MFGSGFEEELKGSVNVEDVELPVLRQFLRYLYIGKLEPQFSCFKKLLVLADRYKVEDLVVHASNKILDSLSKENAPRRPLFDL